MTYFYLPASGQVYSEATLFQNTGFAPTTDPAVLAAAGVYPVIETTNPYDTNLYIPTPTYTVVGDYAEQGWVGTPVPLETAKANGSTEAKNSANEQINSLCAACGYTNEILTAVSSQDPASRPTRYQQELDEMTAITDKLDSDLTAIDTATSVDEINNIVNKPTGIINTGRGSGLGPEDLNPSYYVEFNSVSLTPEQTELYVPGTSTVIPYTNELPPPYTFDSMGDCFNEGDYLIQIRETATSMVIAEFEVPLNAEGQDVSF